MIQLSKSSITYTFSKAHLPAIHINSGDTIQFECLDALNDQIHSEADSADKIDLDHVNPATGPVYVNGAQPGDTLVAEILDIQPFHWGCALIVPGFGFLHDTIPGPYTKMLPIEQNSTIPFTDKISLPVRPMIGTIGVAPRAAISTLSSGTHGGNLDTRDIGAGSTLYLPVFVAGALFGVGDVHAQMGDGEVCGTGVECSAYVTIRLSLLKGQRLLRPRLETLGEIMTIASARSLNKAIQTALRDMIVWLQKEHGLSVQEAYVLTSLAGNVRIGQIVDPMVTVRVALPKSIFCS